MLSVPQMERIKQMDGGERASGDFRKVAKGQMKGGNRWKRVGWEVVFRKYAIKHIKYFRNIKKLL